MAEWRCGSIVPFTEEVLPIAATRWLGASGKLSSPVLKRGVPSEDLARNKQVLVGRPAREASSQPDRAAREWARVESPAPDRLGEHYRKRRGANSRGGLGALRRREVLSKERREGSAARAFSRERNSWPRTPNRGVGAPSRVSAGAKVR
jgi:hypothetical protein